MTNCETCKYWGYGEYAYEAQYENTLAKMCGKIGMLNWRNSYDSSNNYDSNLPIEYIYGKSEEGYAIVEKEIMHHKAYCVDGSSYRAELVTRPDFGCVLWEKKYG